MATVTPANHFQSKYSDDDLKTALAAFETSLLTPRVSGELVTWLEQVQKTWEEASAQVHYRLKHVHPRQYDEISKQNSELLPRTDQLRAEAGAIEDERAQLAESIGRLAQQVPKLEPDEEAAQMCIKSIVDQGTAFLTQVRKQEVAVQTWYIEAFNRDCGSVD
jgi:chromosome segregation ATPase